MDSYLLTTKIQLPHPRATIISRTALLTQLEEGSSHKLILISAPAGSGKTTALTEWISYSMKKQAHPRFIWLSLDREDNDIQRFWNYILAACQKIYSEISDLVLYYTSIQATTQTLLKMLINTIAAIGEPFVLVLDNFHTITNEEIHQSVAYLLDHNPDTLRIIISTRYDPLLPLARLRAKNDILEIRDTQLNLSEKEIVLFFNQIGNSQLSPEDSVSIGKYTGGWIAGLQLIMRELRAQIPYRSAFSFKNFITTNSAIIDYVRDEILSDQSAPIQEFLLKTSILAYFTSDLCAAVTELPACADILEYSTHANLFLIPINQSHSWYRYHPLFAEAMRCLAQHRFGQEQMQALYKNASHWYEQHGFLFEAVDTALLAQDFKHGIQLIQHIVSPLTLRFESLSLIRWIEQLPQEHMQHNLDLYLTYAACLLFTSRQQELLPVLRTIEQICSTEANQEKLSMAFILRAFIAWWWKVDYPAVGSLASLASSTVTETNTLLRSASDSLLALVQKQEGNIHKAWIHMQETQPFFLSGLNTLFLSYITVFMGDILLECGNLDKALQYYKQSLQEDDVFRISHKLAHIGIGIIFLERGDLIHADNYFSRLYDIDMNIAAHQFLIPAWYHLAYLQRAQGKREQAQETLIYIAKQAKKQKQMKWQNLVNAYQAWFSLLDGDITHAIQWARSCDLQMDDQPVYIREKEYLLLARTMIASGKLAGVFEMLERWYNLAVTQKRLRSQLKFLLLKGLAYQVQGDNILAFQYVREVMIAAQPQSFMHIFLEEGNSMALLLRRMKLVESESALLQYIEVLLQAFGNEVPGNPLSQPVPVTAALLEQLTQREYSVLLLLIDGKSRQEVAQQLTISVNTAKTHIKNLYSKLNVNTCKEAIEVARRVHIL